LNLARFLVVVSFVWPFINTNYFLPESQVEINFLPVFLAIGLAPELLFEDLISLFLIVAAVAAAAIWGTVDSALRLIIGAVPCLFLVCLYRYFLRRGKELIPRPVAYWALLIFVGFCALQYVNFEVFPLIPDWLTKALTVIVPRYMDTPYDELGTRGVQGWASEPSSAAMTCFSFCAVAMQQDPKKRWRILFLFCVLGALNKSVYALLFLILLGIACLCQPGRKRHALVALVPFGAVVSYFVLQSSRIAEVRESLLLFGANQDVNRELLRFGQLIYPLSAFPGMYHPVDVFEISMKPLGLFPLLIGYGSVIGAVLYWRLAFRGLRLSQAEWRSLGFATVLVLSFMSSPDFIPVIVAFAYGLAPNRATRGIDASLTAAEAC